MNSFNTGLRVSCLALLALLASCSGQNIGSPIQDKLDAVPAVEDHEASRKGNVEFEWKVEKGESMEADLGLEASDGRRSVSFTPGLPVPLAAGAGFPNILGYGWKGGMVTEGAAPSWVKLTTTDKRKPAWIRYHMQEAVAGRLLNLRIHGAGSGMQVHMYNWSTGTWNSFGMHNLSAGPANIPVAIQYAPNGMTYLRLSEPVVGSTRIDKIESWVF
ncbi:hypothetical protein IT575_01995 [bacterium]|nr:hypothetical protein [bacterium]